MKTNFKFLTIASILFLSTITTIRAQEVALVKTNDWRLGVGVNLGTTLGDFDNTYGLTLGGDLKLQRDITESLSGTLTTGYNNFFAKDAFVKDLGYVPLKAGLKVFPTKGFYFSAEVGAGFASQKVFGTGFLYSPGLGVAFAKNYDISARYEAVNFKNDVTLGQVALRLAYAFSL